ncbi:MAG: AtpZ/AtpI family protein [Planctomycetota bacterium]|jgi:hypothetical protein
MVTKRQIELMKAVGRYSHIGFMLGIFAVGGFFLGHWIDGKLWKYPVLGVLFFFIGFGLVFYRFILMLQEDAEEKNKKPPPAVD